MPNDKFVPIPRSILDEPDETPTQPEPNTEVDADGTVLGYMTPPGKPAVLGKKVRVTLPGNEGPGDEASVEFLAPLAPPKEAPGVVGTAVDVAKQVGMGVVDAAKATIWGASGFAAPETGDAGPETGAGAFARSTSEFLTGMVGAGKLFKAANILQGPGKALGLARGTAESVVTSRMLYDATEGRLSNMLVEHPWAANAVTRWMAAKPDDTTADAFLKDTLEGLLTGGAFEGFLGALKGMRAARAASTPEAAQKILAQTAEEVATIQSSGRVTNLRPLPGKEAEFQARPAGLAPGTVVSPMDRNNYGKVVSVDAEKQTAMVHFISPEGHEATKEFPLDQLVHQDRTPVSVAKPIPEAPKVLMPETVKAGIIQDLASGAEGSSRVSEGRDFNFDTMEGPDAAKQAINLVSDALAPEISKLKGGVQTLKETSELADILGEEPAKLMANLSQDAADASSMAARVVAGKRLLQSVGRQIADEARLVQAGTAIPERLNKLIDVMGNLETNLKTTITGAARTTSAGRIRTAASFTTEELNLLVASGGDPKVLRPLIKEKTLFGKIVGVHNEVWINALLSNPLTHSKNVTGGLFNTLMQPLDRTVGGLMSLDVASAREGISTFVGLWKSQTEALKMAWKAFKTEAPVLTPRDAKYEAVSKSIPGFWGKAVRLSSRFLLSEDEFFQQLNYRANLYSKFTRQGMDLGLKGEDLAAHVQSNIERSFLSNGQANLDSAITQEAKRQGSRATFTEDLRPDSYAAEVARFVTTHPEARAVLPFVRTPYNILRQSAQRAGPIGLFTKTLREDIAAGGARRAEALGRMGTGSAIGVSALGYAMSGNITGGRPKGPDGRLVPMPEGWQPYSIKVGNRYISYQGLEPLSTMLGTIADMVQLSEHVSEDERNGLGAAIVAGITSNLSNKAYLQGITQLIDVIDSDDPNKVEAFIRQRAASYVPAVVGQAAREADPLTRQAWDLKEQMMLRIPGLSDKVPPMYNLLGKPVEHTKGTFMVNPFSFSDSTPGHVTEELSRLAKREGGFQMPPRTLDKVQLSHEQYARMMELRGSIKLGGKNLEDRLSELVKSDKYKNLGDSIGIYKSAKREFIERIFGQYQNAAEKKLTQEDKGLAQARQQSRVNAKATLGNRPDLVKPEASQGADALLRLLNPNQQ